MTRQVLFSEPRLAGELRYFEMAPGGYSTLERHEHMHAVMILRGEGRCWSAPRCARWSRTTSSPSRAWTWHQFRATPASRSAFSAWSTRERDRPQLPTPEELAALRADPDDRQRFLDGEDAWRREEK